MLFSLSLGSGHDERLQHRREVSEVVEEQWQSDTQHDGHETRREQPVGGAAAREELDGLLHLLVP